MTTQSCSFDNRVNQRDYTPLEQMLNIGILIFFMVATFRLTCAYNGNLCTLYESSYPICNPTARYRLYICSSHQKICLEKFKSDFRNFTKTYLLRRSRLCEIFIALKLFKALLFLPPYSFSRFFPSD